MRKLFFRYNLTLILLIFLLAPFLLSIIQLTLGENCIPEKLKPNYHLLGFTDKKLPRPTFTLSNFQSHEIQKYLEQYLAAQMPIRSWLIRLNNQIYYSLCKKSYSEGGGIIIGKKNQFLTITYINSYCNQEKLYSNEMLQDWAKKLQKLHQYYTKQGKVFIYLITPSKIEYMPETIPNRFHCKYRGIPTYIYELTRILDEKKIPYVNSPLLMVEATKKYKTPMFSQGGIHWNYLGSTLATNELIARINKERQYHIKPLSFTYELTNEIDLHARDIMDIANLLFPPDYLAPKLNFESRVPNNKPLTLSIIGGSFCEQILETMLYNKIVHEIKEFSYFNQREVIAKNNSITINPIDPHHLLGDINDADIIILEGNSIWPVPPHCKQFYDVMNKYLD